MGFSKKPQVEVTKVAGIGIRAPPPLKPISTRARGDDGAEEERSTTPTARESRIPEPMTCPPAPRKRRPVKTCQAVMMRDYFFVPPDLESVFIRLGESAN